MIETIDDELVKRMVIMYMKEKKKTLFRQHIFEQGVGYRAVYRLPKNWGYYSEHFTDLVPSCIDGIIDDATWMGLNLAGTINLDDWRLDSSCGHEERKERFNAYVDRFLIMKHKGVELK